MHLIVKERMISTMPTADIAADDRQLQFERLYRDVFPVVAKFVAKRGGSFDDAKDIFHDSLVILYEKMIDKEFATGIPEQRYLAGVAKHLWFRKFKDDNRKIGFDDMEKSISIPQDYFDSSDNRLISVLELTGRKCVNLLRAFYYDRLPIQRIKNAFGFASDHSASVQKYKCIEKVREIVQKKSLGYEDFA
jgi:DNA-directed RNA polymerase specialized sigma24 family protein